MEKLRELIYSPDFREIISQNPGALKSFLKLEKEILEISESIKEDKSEKTFEDGNVKVTPLYDKVQSKNYVLQTKNKLTSYLKVEIGELAYFVKTVPGLFYEHENTKGVGEYNSLKKVAEYLSEIDGVRVVRPEFGYEDEKNKRTYFVSKWMDLPNVLEFQKNANKIFLRDLQVRLDEIISTLKKMNIIDTHTENMFYDQDEDIIYVFDVFDASTVADFKQK